MTEFPSSTATCTMDTHSCWCSMTAPISGSSLINVGNGTAPISGSMWDMRIAQLDVGTETTLREQVVWKDNTDNSKRSWSLSCATQRNTITKLQTWKSRLLCLLFLEPNVKHRMRDDVFVKNTFPQNMDSFNLSTGSLIYHLTAGECLPGAKRMKCMNNNAYGMYSNKLQYEPYLELLRVTF